MSLKKKLLIVECIIGLGPVTLLVFFAANLIFFAVMYKWLDLLLWEKGSDLLILNFIGACCAVYALFMVWRLVIDTLKSKKIPFDRKLIAGLICAIVGSVLLGFLNIGLYFLGLILPATTVIAHFVWLQYRLA